MFMVLSLVVGDYLADCSLCIVGFLIVVCCLFGCCLVWLLVVVVVLLVLVGLFVYLLCWFVHVFVGWCFGLCWCLMFVVFCCFSCLGSGRLAWLRSFCLWVCWLFYVGFICFDCLMCDCCLLILQCWFIMLLACWWGVWFKIDFD